MVRSRIITIAMLKKKILIPIVIVVVAAATFFAFVAAGQNSLKEADAHFTAQNYAEAAKAYERSARLLFWQTGLWEKAGIASAKGGDTAQAITYLDQAGDTLSEEGWGWLGSSYLSLGEVDSAIEVLQRGLQTHEAPMLHGLLAFAYRQKKDWPAERAALEAQLRLDPNGGDVYARYRLGLLLSVLEPEQALTDLMLASSLNPEFDPAVQTLRTALNLSATQPDASEQMIHIGRALGLVQEWDLAVAAFEKAIALNAENAEAWAWLGEAKQQSAQSDAENIGLAELNQAVLLDHESVTVRALRGLYWRRQEKYPQMLAEYLLAAEYDPTNPAWQAEIGNAYIKRGDLVSALAAYQHATELAPDDPTYWRLLAVFCAENTIHMEDIGLPAAEKAVELAPNDPLTLDALGWAYLSSGRFANAENIFVDLITRFPDHLQAHIHLALTYLSMGDRDAAFEKLNEVKNMDPAGPYGQEAGRLLQLYFP